MTNHARAIHGAAWTLILAGITVILALAIHPMSAHAGVTWKAQTCTAAAAYQGHPTTGSLATLVTDSTHLPRGYLKADAGQLYADASSPSAKAAKYVAKDAQWIAEDCA